MSRILPALLLASLGFLPAAEPLPSPDEETLTQAGIPTDGPGLLEFFRQRTAAHEKPKWLEGYVRQLGSGSYDARKKATQELIRAGPPAIPLLQAAQKNPDVEVVRRADLCLKALAQEPALPIAAARLLAQRTPFGAVAALLAYLPFVEGEELETEVYNALGRLAIRRNKIDLRLLAALDDPNPRRRGAAVFLLGQRGGAEQRATLRKMLADPDALVRRKAAQGVIGKELYQQIEQGQVADKELLQANKIGTDGPNLVAFFRKRSLTDADRERVRRLVEQLGDRSFRKRTQAERDLIGMGTPALPFLRPALSNPDLEVVKRAEKCLRSIENGPGTALPLAAARQLARQRPADAVQTFLHYLPSAEDRDVEDGVLASLCVLSVHKPDLDPALRAALADPEPARRGGAAYVLGRVGTREDCRPLRSLARDVWAEVRYRAAQGLLYAGDKSGALVMVDLLAGDASGGLVDRAEQMLRLVAGPGAPQDSVAGAEPADRRKAWAAWQEWWRKESPTLDLVRLNEQNAGLGLYVICVFDGSRRGTGLVWEFGQDFKPRWTIQGLQGPMDAHVLGSDRVLIAEYYGRRVTERSFKGKVNWEYGLTNYPVACAPLPNGNVFIATYNSLMEVRRDKKPVYNLVRTDGQIYSAQRLPNGHILYITSAGFVVELDPYKNREVHRRQFANPGAWCGVEGLPNGRVLVSLMSTGEVKEVNLATGHVSWRAQVVGAHQTLRLPNGHTMIMCMNNRKLVEVNQTGKVVSEKVMDGRPWRVHRR